MTEPHYFIPFFAFFGLKLINQGKILVMTDEPIPPLPPTYP